MSVRSRSNWNLKVLVFKERGKPEYPEKNLWEQGREPTTNSTHIWRRRQDSNPGHIGGRRVLSPLRYPCSSLTLLFKCIKGNGPDDISSLFEPRILRYNVTNREHNLTQPSYNNRYYHNSSPYKASHLWNQLPSYIKRSTVLSEFLKHLISFDLINLRVSCKCSLCMSLGFYSILDVFIYFFFLRVFNLFLGFLIFN